jgi:hypothetical protein
MNQTTYNELRQAYIDVRRKHGPIFYNDRVEEINISNIISLYNKLDATNKERVLARVSEATKNIII